ncbi:hypothetical protein [Oceanirhabdus sp. W0125-5]|uniref:hypothetical protein n=1 Tax=Oceanirhabdus sp. W0125-5 TaxID=2999116 RepID=UPI0022F322EF|nr:hypothetical protein [Oceanirhabdus sp. W0125-5]WBW98221.1 hypothetical protein OW730_05495 [Oceanirhabdus sp. W0125-5]
MKNNFMEQLYFDKVRERLLDGSYIYGNGKQILNNICENLNMDRYIANDIEKKILNEYIDTIGNNKSLSFTKDEISKMLLLNNDERISINLNSLRKIKIRDGINYLFIGDFWEWEKPIVEIKKGRNIFKIYIDRVTFKDKIIKIEELLLPIKVIKGINIRLNVTSYNNSIEIILKDIEIANEIQCLLKTLKNRKNKILNSV